ncbi:MAG TPA: acetate/propionate family kinase [Kiloniellaceae bacterium]|nr:acetate/propionate family kinase [Kiloniellaceae bacterium]
MLGWGQVSEKQRAILVLNAGSSSIKLSLFPESPEGGDAPLVQGMIEGIGTAPRFAAKLADGTDCQPPSWDGGAELGHDSFYASLLDWIGEHLPGIDLVAAGHRVVHGGTGFEKPQLVDKTVLETLESLVPLAPLHQPHNLSAIRALQKRKADLPQVACFDTAFHRSIPELDQLYGLPRDLAQEGLRRYGFHGLSYEFIADALPNYDTFAATGRAIVAHLGNGASLCALRNGRSQACTMGFSTLDGLIMGTRCGSLDPGVLLYLMREKGMDADALEHMLYRQSGLLGLSGISSDMRDLLNSSKAEARESVSLFCDRVAQKIAALVAMLGGLDALVFTAGIGERSPEIRRAIGQRLGWLGIVVDEAANAEGRARISATESNVAVWVIPTNEELMIARHSRAVLAASGLSTPGVAASGLA